MPTANTPPELFIVEPPAPKPKNGTPLPPGFAEFWATCPHKTGKKNAINMYLKATKLAPPETIASAWVVYVDYCTRTSTIMAYPATWLNAERWTDEYPTPITPRSKADERIANSRDIIKHFAQKEGYYPNGPHPDSSLARQDQPLRQSLAIG